MTDDEYFWEPVAECWSLRQQSDGRWLLDGGGGGGPAPDPVPPTTIAWRIGHLAGHAVALPHSTRKGGDETLAPAWGPYAESSVFSLVLHMFDETVHHGAEVGLMRDLYQRRDELGR